RARCVTLLKVLVHGGELRRGPKNAQGGCDSQTRRAQRIMTALSGSRWTLGSRSDGALERVVIVPAAPGADHLLQQLAIIQVVVDEIRLGGVHDQQRRSVI